jgi:DNA mismatch repair protein MutL
VAKVRISSLTQNPTAEGNLSNPADAAFIEVNYGRAEVQGQAVLPYGTLVEVRDLFSNVPARLKFLKTNATELKRCQDVVARAALAREEVTFVFYSGTRELYRFMQGENLRSRLARLWPPQIISALGEVELTRPGIKIRGLVGHPGAAQPKGDRMLFYVNGRAINNRLLQQAVRQAYRGRLLAREYPQVALFVDIDPQEVDVNVHPAKSEVRFRDERGVFGVVLRAVEQSIAALTGSSEFAVESGAAGNYPDDLEHGREQPQYPLRMEQGFKEPQDKRLGFWGALDKKFVVGAEVNESVAPYTADFAAKVNESVESGTVASYTDARAAVFAKSTQPEPAVQPDADTLKILSAELPKEPSGELPGGFVYLGQLAETYLMVIKGDKLLLLDQHAAHERVLMQRFSGEATAGQTQMLVLPLELQLHPAEAAMLQQLWGDLLKLGFSMRSTGGTTLSVNGVPPLLSRTEAGEFLLEALAAQGNALQELLIMMSCKGAIKAGQKLSKDEALMLLQEWLAVPEREYCPHGRPAVLVFGVRELEKMFKRRK